MPAAQRISDVHDDHNKFLALEINGHGFGIPISKVREIVYHTNIKALPQAPDFVRGVTLVRQETIPVLDLNILLGANQPSHIHQESCFIVVQLADKTGRLTQVCLLADQVLQTYKIESTVVDLAPTIGDNSIVDYVLGIARIEERIFMLIDPMELIAPYLEVVQPYHESSELTDSTVTETISGKTPSVTRSAVKYKFLSVFIDEDEYAFPLSSVSQVVNKSDLAEFSDQEMPDILSGVVIFNDKPLGIVRLCDIISHDKNNDAPTQTNLNKVKNVEYEREVVVLVEFHDGLLGIVVDSIGQTYESTEALTQNLFCADLQRNRVKSLGFIDSDNGSIEVIEPIGLLVKEEQAIIDSWIRCNNKIVEISDSQNTPAKKENHNSSNPLAKYADSYLVIQLGESLVAIKSLDVDEILSYEDLITIESGPVWFSGLLDLRQKTYPVIDLHIKLDVPALTRSTDSRNVLVMIYHKEQKLGLLVDKIIASTNITEEQIQSSEFSNLVIQPIALDAVAETEHGLVNIINLHQVITRHEISARRLLEKLNEQNEE